MPTDDARVPDEVRRLRHALRTPLAAIILNVDLLRLKVQGSEELAALRAIEAAASEIKAAVAG